MKLKLNRRGATQVRRAALVVPVLAMGVITGCSSINEAMQPDKIDYKSSASKRTPTLDIPPDLTKLDGDRRYSVPDQSGTSTLSNYSQSTRRAKPRRRKTSCPRRRACAWSATATSAGS